MDRTPFADAVEDEKLLKFAFDQLSLPQQVTLKAFYGCPLRDNVGNLETGWSELDYWAVIQGSCVYDELGFVQKIFPISYAPKEYEQLWAVVGRRAGKTSSLMAFIVAYEALLGGHEEFIQGQQDCVIYLIAHRLGLAQGSMNFVRNIINSSPLLSNEIASDIQGNIRLKNGISIMPSPPNLKAQRGVAVPVAAMDEVGFWYSDPESANPDFEVERAVAYSQMQFPFKKRVGISTPWTKEGLLWKYHLAGTEGKNIKEAIDRASYDGILVCFAPTAAFENPGLVNPRRALGQLRQADPEAFDRESLCKFLDSISGFVNAELVNIAVRKGNGVAERLPVDPEADIQPMYVAAMDPAFRNDSFGFCICHKDTTQGIVVDILKRWTPIRGEKLNPSLILNEIKEICTKYGIMTVYTDQYQFESLQQLALELGMVLEAVDFTGKSKPKIYGNLNTLFNQQKIVLLDPKLNIDAKVLVDELVILEKRITLNGTVQISAPEGKHDDMPAVLALGSYKAAWMDPVVMKREVEAEPTIFELGMKTLNKHRMADQF